MEEHSSDPYEIPSKTVGPAPHKKHLAMLERLSKSHQSRKSETPNSTSLESTASFLSRFSDSKRLVESLLAESRLIDPSNLKTHIEKISSSISDLEKLVAENSYYLPSYEVRSSLKTISDLKQSLENLNSELIPRKKFSFKNKSAKKDLIISPKDTEIPKQETVLLKKPGLSVRESPGIRNRQNEILGESFKGLEVGEFTISDLENCEVTLKGCARVIFIHRLRNCRVYAGPVMASILIEEVEGCVFVLASHQIRIHNAKRTDCYLRVRSRPIIEDSSGLRFAPYCLSYEGIEEDLKDASLDEETGNWANVDDFRWLRAVQSPNWSILPEEERVRSIDITNGMLK